MNASDDLQGTIRKVPEALLGMKVVVCEGKTELGICRKLEIDYWQKQRSKPPIAYEGAVLVEGEGSNHGSKIALNLAKLGYSTCLFIDGDKVKDLEPDIKTLIDNGVKTLHWDKEISTEQQLATDFSWGAIKLMVELGIKHRSEESVFDSICQRLSTNVRNIGTDLDSWLEQGLQEQDIRKAIGEASQQKKKEWFKNIEFGEALGELIIQDFPNLTNKETGKILSAIEDWIYG